MFTLGVNGNYNFYKLKQAKALPDIRSGICLQEKIDGYRVVFIRDKKGKLTVRTKNLDITFLFKHITIPIGCTLEGEMFHVRGLNYLNSLVSAKKDISRLKSDEKPKVYFFDVKTYRGKNLSNEPYSNRLKALDLIFLSMSQSIHARKIDTYTDNFNELLSDFEARGSEGVVVKDLDSSYGESQYKIKFTRDIPFLITGITKTSLQVGFTTAKGQLKRTGSIKHTKQALKQLDNFKVGQVIEVECYGVSENLAPISGKLKYIRLDRDSADITREYITEHK